MFTDLQSRENRLKRKTEKGDLTATQLIVAVLIGLPVLWFTLVVLFSMTPNI